MNRNKVMVRRRKPEANKVNHDRWLVSYADFITLLFAFFVVMYSVSQVSESKYRTLSETLQTAFATRPEGTGEAPGPLVENADLATMSEVATRLRGALGELIEQERVTLTATEDWVEVAVNANLLFESGSARPSEEARRIFAELAALLAPFENAVDVSGHTDSVPIQTAAFNNNWELSAARATAVVTVLAEEGIAPARMSATGYGEFRPVADNSSEEGRAANRRVVLHVARHRAERPASAPAAPAEQLTAEEAGPSSGGTGETVAPGAASGSAKERGSEAEPTSQLQPIVRDDGSLLFTNDPERAEGRTE